MKRILVIDDSQVMLDRIQVALIGASFDVVTTTQIVGNARYLATCDLVLVDYHMPGLDGAQVVASMRASTSRQKNKCLLYLYTFDDSIARNYRKLGFDGVFASKGDEQALTRQVVSLFRMLDVRRAVELRHTRA